MEEVFPSVDIKTVYAFYLSRNSKHFPKFLIVPFSTIAQKDAFCLDDASRNRALCQNVQASPKTENLRLLIKKPITLVALYSHAL